MGPVLPGTDSPLQIERYVRRLAVSWTVVVIASLIWNLGQHTVSNLGSDLPLFVEIGGHVLMWLLGLGVLYFGAQRFRTELAARQRVEDEWRKLSRAVEQSPASIIITDLQGHIEYVNPKFTQVSGYRPDEVVGQNPRLLKSGEMSSEQYRQMWETVLSGREWRGEFHNRRKNGDLYWESASISPIKNAQGVITHLLAVKEDITDRKRIAAELESVARFPAENPNPVLRLTRDGQLLYANAAGQVLLQTQNGSDAEQVPEYVRDLVAESAASGQNKVVDLQQADRYWSVHVTPIAGSDYVNLYASDITHRKLVEQAERDLHDLAEALRNTAADLNSTLEFDTVLDRILVNVGRVVPHDEANIMLISNDTAYVCLSRGREPYPILTAQLSVTQTPHLYQMMETGRPVVISEVGTHDNWTHLSESNWIRSYVSAPIRVKGETLGFINLDSATPGFFNAQHAARLAIFADQAATAVENARLYQQAQTELHERRRIEVELQRAKEAAEAANRAKSVFLANMSHELRTPLNAILGFAQLLSHDSNLTTDQHDDLSIVMHSGQHLLSLINDVLDMSKIEAGRLTLHPDNFDLLRLLNTVEEMFRLRATDKHLSLRFELDPLLPRYLHADEGKLRQVLINLLGNAVKYTLTGGITLRAHYRAEQLWIDVEDTGPGMTPAEMGIIFEPFVQAAGDQRPQEGTGLGLSISRQFIRLMGGELTAASEPGRGSTFSVHVPVQIIAATAVPSTPVTRRALRLEDGQPTYRLLVVDDRDVSRRLLVKLLEPMGFQLREAATGREAVEIWEDWRPHLIWMDMRMPIMDGHEATRLIKATTQGQATIIVALTASALQDDRDVILAEGCDDFIRKPFREDEIIDRLTRHLGARFVYEDEPGEPEDRSSTPEAAAEAAALAAAPAAPLPADWLDALQQATIRADLDRMLGLIEQLRPTRAALATQLADWANHFNYEQIAHFIQHAGEHLV